MAMVKARCVDGPRAGTEVWLPAEERRWVRPAFRGFLHYAVAGRPAGPDSEQVLELVFRGKSRRPVEAGP